MDMDCYINFAEFKSDFYVIIYYSLISLGKVIDSGISYM